jgi:two-component system CheB/CheR fusion protein
MHDSGALPFRRFVRSRFGNQRNNEQTSEEALTEMNQPHKDGAAHKEEGAVPTSLLVVGIGASAGGLESLENFFGNVPEDAGMAFVVIQHLSPDFKSMMDELLARHTTIPIHRAEEGMEVEPNNIYLLPPKKEMMISEGRLHLKDKDSTQAMTLPIDHFFRSLAQDFGERAVAVVLSGTGSDGSRGIKDIHHAGGWVLCEDANTAKFDGMPLSAQETGLVDRVLAADEMPAALLEYMTSPQQARLNSKRGDVEPLAGIEAVFELLRREYDIDFSHYKPTTVSRRIERRLSLVHADDIDEYVERLHNDSDELNALYKDLLIGVTKFFRDAEPFGLLERDIIPDLLRQVPEEEEIRVWVAGCATGEEPYSLAILFHEAFERAERPHNIKIFATDVHKASLVRAGYGVFDHERLAEVSPERLRRYFTKKDHGYQISQDLRQWIVFARHNVIKDAPFTNLDLICCRNLLIYFQPQAQKKALSLFHFGLKTRGILLLGSSESPGALSDEFETLDEHSKVYRKRRDARLPTEMSLPLARGTSGLRSPLVPVARNAIAPPDAALVRVYDQLLDKHMPASLLIDEKRKLIESFGGAEKLLRVKGRRPSPDLLDWLDTDAKTSIAGALNRVMKHRQPLFFTGVRLTTGGQQRMYRLGIEPIEDDKSGECHYLITLRPLDHAVPLDPPSPAEVHAAEMTRDQVTNLEDELRYTKENLQATIEELETSNEEMQATNQELVASNEELQSTNEELHSVNEELYTVNAEHQKKIRELAELNQDMEHLLRSTDVAIIFLDRDLCIRKFTPKVAEVFDLVDQDVGRRIGTFSHRIRHDRLPEELEDVLADGRPREREVRELDGRCYFMRILPYRVADEILGVVLALIDISILDEARSRISHLSAIVESSKDAIISVDGEGTITSWNKGAERLYGYTDVEALGQDISITVPEEQREECGRWFDALQRGEHMEAVEVDRLKKQGERVVVSLALSPLKDARGNVVGISLISRDVTERKRMEERFRATIESAPAGMVMIDHRGEIVLVNAETERLFGYPREELVGKAVDVLLPERFRAAHAEHVASYFGKPRKGRRMGPDRDLFALRKDGSDFPVEIGLSPVETEGGSFVLASITDITARREALDKLREEIQRRERFLAMLSHELRNPLSAIRTGTRVLNSGGLDEETDEESRRVIDRQTAQMTRLLDDLLDVSRITQDKITLNKSPLDLRATVESAIESVRPLAKDCQITIDVTMPEEPVQVDGDATRLQQIQANLLNNAIKYSPTGERVWLELGCHEGFAVIRVKDNGAGIDPRALHRIFDMFVQTDNTLDRADGGMGVGLTLVHKLVELHGGSVVAQSQGLGCGSQFEVRLPLARTAKPVTKEAAPSAGQVNEVPAVQRIVIVEDQDDNRTMLASLLELEGFNVYAAASGREGVELVKREQPDVAIIDIGLPEIDGYEVARRIRATDKNHTTLVALTGYGQSQDVNKARSAGFDHHLVKPLQLDKLMKIFSQPTRTKG